MNTENVENLWETIKETMLYPAEKILSNDIRRNKIQWMIDEIFHLIEEENKVNKSE